LASLIVFAWALTRIESSFAGRTFAAYGGVYVAAALALETEISPELLPAGSSEPEQIQSTEEVVGPFELQDFHLYYIMRFGFRPSKVAHLAHHAWGDRERGVWPDLIPSHRRHQYDLSEIKKWLGVFLQRFCSLSPRSDWRAPSDAEAAVWLEELRHNVPGD
jgi:NAD+ synthase (glutamine-hydrolysing)